MLYFFNYQFIVILLPRESQSSFFGHQNKNTTLPSIILNSFVSLSSFLELFLSMLFIGFLFSFCSRNLFLFEMPFGKRCFHTGNGNFAPSITLYPLKTSSFNEPLCLFIDHLSLPSCVCIDVRKPGSLGHESSLHHEQNTESLEMRRLIYRMEINLV